MIQELIERYTGLYNKDVPNRYKNNADWISQKIAEKLDNRDNKKTNYESNKKVEEVTQDKPQEKKAPKKESKFKIIFNGQYEVVNKVTKAKQVFSTLNEAKFYAERYDS